MRLFTALLAASLGVGALAWAGPGPGKPSRTGFTLNPDAVVAPGRIIVKLRRGQTLRILEKQLNLLQAGTPARIYPRHQPLEAKQEAEGLVDLSRMYEVRFTAPFRTEVAVTMLRQVAGVEYAEPRYIHKLCYTPNDPRRTNQIFLTRIQAFAGWAITKGDSNTVVGIIDSGVDWVHPDLGPNIAYNRADPIDGQDNDNDGYVDNFRGWDLAGANFNNITEDNNPAPTGNNNSHGTHVAGIAGAATDNNLGIAGVGFNCRILPVKCAADNDTRSNGSGFILTGYEGITYAADHGADVINCSWGGAGLSSYENDIVNYATFNKNALVIAAAGNSNTDADFFPACFDNVLSVAATRSVNDDRAGFSNYNTRVGIAAPGENIFSTIYDSRSTPPQTYANNSGTSMAAPVVAGAAALIRSALPNLTPAQVAMQLRVTSDDIYQRGANSAPQFQGKLGKGRLNLFRALTARGPGLAIKNYRVSDGNDAYFASGDTLRLRASFINRLFPSTAALTAEISTSNPNVEIDPAAASLNLGQLNTGDSVAQAQNEIKLVVGPGAGTDEDVVLLVTFQDGAYSDFGIIRLTVNATYVNFSANNIAGTVASQGRIGYAGEQQTKGTGVQLAGWGNLLYEMGQVAAFRSGGAIVLASTVRAGQGQPEHDDYAIINSVKPVQPLFATKEYAGAYANNQISARFDHRTYVWEGTADTNFFIYEQTITNRAASAMPNLYTGMYADPDVSATSQEDIVDWDAARNLAYVYAADSGLSPAGGPYFGIKLLSPFPKQYSPIVNDGSSGPFSVYDGFSDQEHFTSISSGIAGGRLPATGRKDVSLSVGYGPFATAAGGTVRVAYAIVVGYNLQQIQAAADRADSAYQQRILSVTSPAEAASVVLYPSPATDQLHVLCQAGAQITVTDLRGVAYRQTPAFAGNLATLNVANLAPGMYLVRVRQAGKTQTLRFVKQ